MCRSFIKTVFLLSMLIALTFPQYTSAQNEQLWMSLFNNDFEAVKDAIKNGADVNAENQAGEKVIFSALTVSFMQADNFSTEVVKLLIDNGADVNVKNVDNQTPLFIACSQGLIPEDKRAELVNLLASKGAETGIMANVHMFSDGTPLMYAAMNGYIKTVETLLKWGADASAKDEFGNNALYWVIKGDPSIVNTSDKTEIIKLLLSKGVDPENQNEYGESALSDAAESGSLQLTDALKGKSTAAAAKKNHNKVRNKTDNSGYPIDRLAPNGRMILAAKQGDLQSIKEALEEGAEITLKDENGNTPLILACDFISDILSSDRNISRYTELFSKRFEVIKFLVESGAAINAVNYRDDNALSVAVKSLLATGKSNLNKTAFNVIRYLVSKGSDVDIDAATTPLMEACSEGSSELVDILLPNVKDINKRSNDLSRTTSLSFAIGNESLMLAIAKNFARSMKKAGAELPPGQSIPENTKLSLDPERIKIVKSLISRRVNVNLPSSGITPLMQAETAGFNEIAELLRKAGAKK